MKLRIATMVRRKPPVSNRGASTYMDDRKSPDRTLPDIQDAPAADGYAELAANGLDSWQENLFLCPSPTLQARLEQAKSEAAAANGGRGQPMPVTIGEEIVQVQPYGGKEGGTRWIAGNAEFQLFFRCPGSEASSTVGVRYLSAALWQIGLPELQRRVYAALDSEECSWRKNRHVSVSYAHQAFDFYAPRFAEEMLPGIRTRVVTHSGVKSKEIAGSETEIGIGPRTETLQIGSKKTLEVVAYDKGREILESSKKSWMAEIWATQLERSVEIRKRTFFRLELRFGKSFLRDRGITTPSDVLTQLPELSGEAIYSRRLTVPTPDSNRWRWPLHPLWWMARDAAQSPKRMVPLGRRMTASRGELVMQLTAQAAGLFRTMAVLRNGEFDAHAAMTEALRIMAQMERDPHHLDKVAATVERYRFIDYGT